jgi:hypothetical protein
MYVCRCENDVDNLGIQVASSFILDMFVGTNFGSIPNTKGNS